MSGTQIGEVSINLRMSLAQFSKDVKQGTEDARTATKGMADDMRGNTQQAKASMALLGEEIGVTIPRHLRTFIAELPGVSTAMSAAFSSVAVLALIEVIVKIVQKVKEWREAAEKAAESWKAADQDIIAHTRKLDEQLLGLQARLADLTGNHLAALRSELKLIDAQTFDHLITEVNKLVADTDKAFAAMDVSWFEKALGGGNAPMDKAKAEFKALTEQIKTMTQEQATAAIAAAQAETQAWRDKGKVQADNGEITKKNAEEIAAAATRESSALDSLKTQYTKVEEIGSDQKAIKTMEEHKRAADEAAQSVKKLTDAMDRAREFAGKSPISSRTNWPALGLPSGDDALGQFAAADQIGRDKTESPMYGGTKEAMELTKVQNDQIEALKQAQKVFTETRTPAEQYQQTLAMLDSLLKQGKVDQETYNRAVTEAQEKMNGTKKAYEQLGQSIGNTINQALLFGRSWTDALKSIIVQIGEMIVKMELLKALDNAGGGGGFGAALIKGLTGGRAAGGSVYGGSSYLVGERGPEIFTPGASGFVTPNGGFGGGGVVNNYVDARGATDPAATEMAVRRAINESRQQAVVQAVTMVNEQQKRRR